MLYLANMLGSECREGASDTCQAPPTISTDFEIALRPPNGPYGRELFSLDNFVSFWRRAPPARLYTCEKASDIGGVGSPSSPDRVVV